MTKKVVKEAAVCLTLYDKPCFSKKKINDGHGCHQQECGYEHLAMRRIGERRKRH
jgi:hypothetical protein